MPFPCLEILPSSQRALWNELGTIPEQFTLYGGTGLALRLGHRQSIDFDFFSNDALDVERMQRQIALLRQAQVVQAEPNALTVEVDRSGPVKLSFFGALGLGQVAAPTLVDPPRVRVAALEDLAATKFKVLAQRAEAKDYLDTHALLQQGVRLDQMAEWARIVFGANFNAFPSVKALTYFEDGDLPSLSGAVKAALRAAARTFGAG